jgi:hypothetical protein
MAAPTALRCSLLHRILGWCLDGRGSLPACCCPRTWADRQAAKVFNPKDFVWRRQRRAGLMSRRTWVRFSPLVVRGVYPEQD